MAAATAPTQVAPLSGQRVTVSSPSTSNSAKARAQATKHPRGTNSAPGAFRFETFSDLGVPIAVLGIVLAMIMPMPSFVLDVLISANITVSVIVLLVSIYITRPVEFSVFPTALLLLTL